MDTIWVFDIDSTIADNSHREGLLSKQCNLCLHQGFKSNVCPNCNSYSVRVSQESWDNFLDPAMVAKDAVISKAKAFIENLRNSQASIAFITGRSSSRLEEVTQTWLLNHVGWQPDQEPLFMRLPDEDHMPARTYKGRALQRLMSQLDEKCNFVFFEDDPTVFSTYIKYGTVLRCPDAWAHINPVGSRGFEL